jgi:hypothetical protein
MSLILFWKLLKSYFLFGNSGNGLSWILGFSPSPPLSLASVFGDPFELRRSKLVVGDVDVVFGDVDVVVASSSSSPIGEVDVGDDAGDLPFSFGWKKRFENSIVDAKKKFILCLHSIK